MAIYLRNDILYVEFACYSPNRKKIRCRESTGLKDTKKNQEIVKAKFKAIKYELKHGHFDYLHFFPHGAKAHLFRTSPDDITFAELWETWLSTKSLRHTTIKNRNSAYRVHIEPHFGHYNLSDIGEYEVLIFRKLLEGKGLKASSINSNIIKLLNMALGYAQKRGFISANPCKDIGKLDEAIPDIDPFSFEELSHFLSVLKAKRPEYYPMMFIWSQTGLRVGELCALEWKHLDFYNSKLMIRQTVHTNRSVGPPKTKHSIRDVDIGPEVMDVITLQSKRTELMDSYIFMTHNGKPFTPTLLRRKFRFLLRLAGLKYRAPKQMLAQGRTSLGFQKCWGMRPWK
jgi:integrase